MRWLSVGRRWAAVFVVVCMPVALMACGGGSSSVSCSEDDQSDVVVSGDEAPGWATTWVSESGGALGGGTVEFDGSPSDEDAVDDAFAAVYACAGLTEETFTEITGMGAASGQQEVRVGVEDYLYRAGQVSVENDRYSVDIALAPTDSGTARFGIAYAPTAYPRSFVDVYAGAFVIQLMREAGAL